MDRDLARTFARTVSLGSISFGTSTVADTTGNSDAFCTTGTLLALGTSSQHAFTIDDLVRRLTLALDAIALCELDITERSENRQKNLR